MGVKHDKRLSDRLPVRTSSKSSTSYSTVLCRADPINCGGGARTSRQRSHKGSKQPSGRVLLKHIPGPKEGRRSKTSDKPEGSEQFCSDRAFQNGGNPYTKRPCQSGGLVGKGGSEGCIFRNPDPPGSSSISQVSFSRQMLSIPMPPIRPVIGSLGLYQDPQASISSPSGDGGTIDSIYRRCPSPGGVQGTSRKPCGGPGLSPPVSGFQSKPEKININPSSGNGVPGINSGHCADGAETPSGKDKKDSCRVTSFDGRRECLSQSPGSAGGEDECYISGDPTSPTVFSPFADGTIRHTEQELSVLRGTSSSDRVLQGGANVVGHPHDKLEWKIPSQEGSRSDNRFRCFPGRVGCDMSDPEDRRSLVQNRGQDAHKLPGAASSDFCSSHIPEKQVQDIGPPQIGQYHGSGIHKQSGRDSLQGIGRLGKEPMDVVPGEEHPHHSPTPPGCSECDSRCGVSDYDRSVRLATKPSPVQQDYQAVWSHRDGPVCLSADHSVPSLFQLAARSLCSSNRCFSAELVSDKGVCQPTLEHDRSGSIPGSNTASSHCAGGTCLEDTAMVPTSSADVDCSATPDHSRSGDAEQRSTVSLSSASRMEYLRERYRDKELSEEATSLMLKSWRTKTNRSYDSLFGKWHSWCRSRDSDSFSGPISEVVNFLAYLYGEGYQYRSLNSYRSAISSVHERVDGYSVGQHPLVTRLMKGVFNNRPPLPRYTSTWNVQSVLLHISSWGGNDSLSLKQISLKTVMLLALTRPSRSADLSQLHLQGKRYKPDGVVFVPGTLAKQSRQGKPVTEFFFPSFPHDSTLCPVITLRAYEERTAPHRGTESRLFLSFIRPFRAVTSSTIARWLKTLLESAGIDTSVFSAHSVRGASSTAAANSGITTNDILKAADWSSESVFQRYYYKPTEDPSFGRAVLLSKGSGQ